MVVKHDSFLTISQAENEVHKFRDDLHDLDDKIDNTKSQGLNLTHDLSVALATKDGLDKQVASTKTTIKTLSLNFDR